MFDKFGKLRLLTQVVIGGLLAMAVIVATTLWTSSGARKAADSAGDKVSEFYLQELAGRRSQLVTQVIDTEFNQMRRALELMSDEDLSSQESLRTFIGRVETLCDLNLFAVVDEDDVVYSRFATYMGGSRYDFLREGNALSDRVVSTTRVYGANEQICLALPVSDRSFKGKPLKACFVQVDIDAIVSTLTYNETEGGEASCGIYYGNGENLAQTSFGPFDADENLLSAVQDHLEAKEWKRFHDGFQQGGQGEVEFSFEDSEKTLYYAPIEGTDWMLTTLISDSVIRNQIRDVSDAMLARSITQICVTVAVLILYFGGLFYLMQSISASMLEQEREHSRHVGERAQKSEEELGEIKEIAYKDALTGVKSKYAYSEEELNIDAAIQDGSAGELGVVVCDVNDLKAVNDTYGHSAGDEYIKSACRLICKLYDHSPVFRVGGDEFVVILRGGDYDRRRELLKELDEIVEANNGQGDVVVAAGMAEYEQGDQKLHDVFHRADQRMYERKTQLKANRRGDPQPKRSA